MALDHDDVSLVNFIGLGECQVVGRLTGKVSSIRQAYQWWFSEVPLHH